MSNYILEELKYYCNESHPVGALLLKGEWGCGKTYFIENDLKNALKDSHVFLRISLFGKQDIFAIQNEVKKAWLLSCLNLSDKIPRVDNSQKSYHTIRKTIKKIILRYFPDSVKEIADSMLSINLLDLLSIKNTIDTKKVVLIFDDLERSTIQITDLLGCINEYSENQHFNVIVIANEEKIIEANKNNDNYSSFKEKLIQKTIDYSPNYQEIVKNVIENLLSNENAYCDKYQTFINTNLDNICVLFSEERQSEQKEKQNDSFGNRFSNKNNDSDNSKNEKHNPHNIRSLKYAIHEFKRLFDLLDEKQINDKEKFLYTFISCVLTYKNYPKEIVDKLAYKLYPEFYDDKYMTDGIKQLIQHGIYNKKLINSEIDRFKEQEKASTPVEKVRLKSIFDLEQKDLDDGFPLLLEKAYNGEIEFNDYVNLINDSCYSRKYKIPIPTINWKLVNDGLDKRINKLLDSSVELSAYRKAIHEEDKDNYSKEEWNLYQRINELYESNKINYSKNRKYYIENLEKDPIHTLIQSRQKIFNSFGFEMADVTSLAFRKIKNADKSNFSNLFLKVWNTNLQQESFDKEESKIAFQDLESKIHAFEKECKKNKLNIDAAHANIFINKIQELLKGIEN